MVLQLYGAGALMATLVSWRVWEPVDWDPAYYVAVARHIAGGEGPMTGAVWSLGWTPPTLPYPADLWWMPLPSRILVPGLWLWPAGGDHLTTALVSAFWGPLAYLHARALGAEARAASVAGWLAAGGLAYAPFVGTPDSVALMGTLGGAATLSVLRGEIRWAAVWCGLAALTRNEGALLGPVLALGLTSWRGAAAVAAPGPILAGLWHLRNYGIGGPDYLRARSLASNVVDVEGLTDLVLANAEPLGLVDRILWVLAHGVGPVALVWVFALPFPTIPLLLWKCREQAWVRGVAVWVLGVPWLLLVMAPGVTASGSLFRGSVAAMPAVVGLLGASLPALGAWGERQRGYDRRFLPGLVVGAAALVGLAVTVSFTMGPTIDREALCLQSGALPPGRPMFHPMPLLAESRCRRPAVVLVRGMTSEQALELAARYGINDAFIPNGADHLDEKDVAGLLPGWSPAGQGWWRAPPPGNIPP